MAIVLKEYIGDRNIGNINIKQQAPDITFREADASSIVAPSPDTLMVEVEGIHAYPFRTRNFTRYMPEALKKSQPRWTNPYLKPLIKHHNDQNGEIIGRIYDAAWTDHTSVENTGGLIFTISVPDKKAAEEVRNRILETVSIGVSATDVRCSVCGSHIMDAAEGCPEGHARGEVYEGQVCCWDIYDIEPKELSYVIVPSDIYAKNRRVYLAKEAQSIVNNIKESVEDIGKKNNSGNGDKEKNMNLEQQLADAKKEIEELQKKLEEAKTKLEELESLKNIKAEKEEQDKKLAEIQALLDSTKTELEDNKQKLVVSEENLAQVSQEKEAAEEAGLAVKEQLRELASRTLNQFRKMSGRTELDEQELKKRSVDSIIDSISDFTEDFNGNKNNEEHVKLTEMQINNPVAPKNPTPEKTEHKDDYRAVNLSEGLESLFVEATKNI